MTAKVGDSGEGQGSIPWRIIGWSTAVFLLLLPLVAMQFTNEVNWTPSDFAVAAGMLGVLGVGLELAFRTSNLAYRMAAATGLAAAFFLFWSTGAVGIIGSEREAANLLYAGVLATALIGALIARFRAGGMAWAMTAAALAQVAVPLVSLVVWPMTATLVWSLETIAATGAFAALWLLSAGLFRSAARGAAEA